MKISTGEKTLVRENKDRIVGWMFDLKDQLRLATRVADNGDTEVLRVDEKGFTKVYSCNVFESCGPVQYHKDGQRVYFITNKGADIDLTRLTLFNPATGKEELVESDPLKRVDLGDMSFLRSDGRTDRRLPMKTTAIESTGRTKASKPTTNCCRANCPARKSVSVQPPKTNNFSC